MTKLSTKLVMDGVEASVVEQARALERVMSASNALVQSIRMGEVNAEDFLNRLQLRIKEARAMETDC